MKLKYRADGFGLGLSCVYLDFGIVSALGPFTNCGNYFFMNNSREILYTAPKFLFIAS